MDTAPTSFAPQAKLRPVNIDNSKKLFDESVQLLSPDHVKANLTKILKFLKSEGRELVFTDVTEKTKVFLENLVRDHNNFKYKSFHSSVLTIGNNIISVLELNKSNYKLVITDESGRSVKNALVFKKQFFSGMKQSSVGTKRSGILSPKSRAFNTTKLPEANKESKISSTFKINLLNTTIKFLKDTNRTEFEYAEMNIAESKLVQDLILKDHEADDVGFGFKCMYAVLWQVLKDFKANGDLQIYVTKGSNNATVILTLKKVYKPGIQKKLVDTKPNITINEEVKPNIKVKKDVKPNIPLTKIIQLNPLTPMKNSVTLKKEEKISGPFLKLMLQTILDFVNDNLRSSLVIGELTLDQAKVVVQLCSMAKKCKSFVKECMELANKLRESLWNLKNRYLLLSTSIGKEVKTKTNFGTRSVIFNKTPALATRKMAIDNNISCRRPTNMSHRNLSLDRSNQKQQFNMEKVRSKSIIQFEFAGPLDPKDMSLDETDIGGVDKVDRGRSRIRDVPKRTAKLMEDLSVPLESEKGMRMMLLMGWKGGALGLHEQGITEPIMPALDIAKGAGLGHVNKKPRSIEEFRKDFIQHITNFTNSEYVKYIIDYLDEPLRKAEVTCLFELIDAINRRSMVICEDDNFRSMLESVIMRIVNSTSGFECSVHPDMSKVFLQKKNNLIYSNPVNNFIQIYCTGQTMPIPDDIEYVTKEVLLNTSRKTGLYEILSKKNQSEKSLHTARFRTTFLSKLLEFSKGKSRIVQFVYCDKLTEKFQCYLVRIIDSLNCKKKPDMANVVEYSIVNDLLNLKRDFDIKLHIGASLLNIILEKRPLLHKTRKNIERFILERNPNLININSTKTTDQVKAVNEKNNPRPEIIKGITEKDNAQAKSVDHTIEQVDTQSKSGKLTSQQNHTESKAVKTTGQQNNTQDKSVKTISQQNETQDKEVKTASVTNNKTLIPNNKQNNPEAKKVKTTSPQNSVEPKTNKPASHQNESRVKINDIKTVKIDENYDVILLEREIPVFYISDDEAEDDNNVKTKTVSDGINCESKENAEELYFTDRISNKDSFKSVSTGTDCEINKTMELINGQDVVNLEEIADTKKVSHNDNPKSVDKTACMESEVTNNIYEIRREPETSGEKAVETTDTACNDPSNTVFDKDLKETDANNNTKDLDCIDKEVNDMNLTYIELDLSAIEMIEDDLLNDDSYYIYNEGNHDINDLNKAKNKENDSNLKDLENGILDSDESDEQEMEYSSSSKRFRDDTGKDSDSKKSKPNIFDKFKNISIVPENYPIQTIDYAKAALIQELISKHFDSSEAVLPRLKCLGLQDGGLVYCCHTEITYFWLENIISVARSLKLKMVDFNNEIDKIRYKVALRMRCFIKEDCDVIFKRIMVYNKSLLTEQWVVLKETRINDVLIVKIDIDCDSYDYICKENFKLYAGVDQAQFSLVFD